MLPGGIPLAFPNRVPEQAFQSANRKHSFSARAPAFVLFLILTAGTALWFWGSHTRESSAAGNDDSEVRSTLHLETFVLNLADTDQKSYLRIGIDLGLNRKAEHGEELPVAQVRDTILAVLGEAKADDLASAKSRDELKQKLLRALRDRVPQLGVQEVYFTEFLIQR